MKIIFFLFLICLVPSLVMTADEQALQFGTELSLFRKDLIKTCALFKDSLKPDEQKLVLGEIENIMVKWQKLNEAFAQNPPAEYAKDPAWRGYFVLATDNFLIMQQKAQAGHFARAKEFCGSNCGVFVQMNQINGIERISDQLFMLRKNGKTALAMLKAGNTKGAQKLIKQCDAILTVLKAMQPPKGMTVQDCAAELQQVEASYIRFTEAVNLTDNMIANKTFDDFLKVFSVVYPKFI